MLPHVNGNHKGEALASLSLNSLGSLHSKGGRTPVGGGQPRDKNSRESSVISRGRPRSPPEYSDESLGESERDGLLDTPGAHPRTPTPSRSRDSVFEDGLKDPRSCYERSETIESCSNVDNFFSRPVHLLRLGLPGEYPVLLFAKLFSPLVCPFTANTIVFCVELETALLYLIGIIVTVIMNTIVFKRFFRRPRPDCSIRKSKALKFRKFNHFSFPSGDSSQAGVFGMALGASGYTWAFLCIPGTMFGRVYFGAHYAFDTVAGAGVGIALMLVTQDFSDRHLDGFFEKMRDSENSVMTIFKVLWPITFSMVLYDFWLDRKKTKFETGTMIPPPIWEAKPLHKYSDTGPGVVTTL